MGFLDDLSDVIVETGNDMKERADKLRELARLKREYKETERYVNNRYQELGKKYYDKNKNKAKKELGDVTEALSRLDYLQEEMDKVSGNDVVCSVCGAKNLKDAVYCSKCGSKIDYNGDVEEEEAPAEKVDAEVVEDDKSEEK